MKRVWLIILLIPSLAGAQVIPTPEWISVWSDSTTFNTGQVQPGAVIKAYDPQGVLCGEFTVTAAGSYGLMPVYRDDPLTPLVDEGADPGDVITFEIDGITARAKGPDAPTWTVNGDVKKIHLAYEKVLPTYEWVSFWSGATTVRTAPVPAGSVVRAYDPGGVLCGEFVVHTDGSYGLMPVYRDDAATTQIDEGADPGDVISFTIDGDVAHPKGPGDTVWGANGQVKNVDLDVPGVAALLTESRVTTSGGTVTAVWYFSAGGIETSLLSVWRRLETPDASTAFVRLAFIEISRRGNEYTFTDSEVRRGERYTYRVGIDSAGKPAFVDLGSVRVPAGRFALYRNFPNPFSDHTTVEFEVPERTSVNLAVYDVQGRLVRRLINGRVIEADTYEVEWDGRNDAGARAAKGVYFVRLEAGTQRAVRKLTLVR
jgi:hypothetical protein